MMHDSCIVLRHFESAGVELEGRLKRLPAGAEFVIVITAAFGWFIYVSLRVYLHGRWGAGTSNAGGLHLVTYEAVLLPIIGAFLVSRGWTIEKIGLVPSWKDLAMGLVLLATIYVTERALWYLLYATAPSLAAAAHVHISHAPLSPWIVVGLLAVNPLFEEVFVAGYVITALKDRFGAVLVVNASLTIRLLYHLYQGVGAVLWVAPMGLIFGIWYARTKRLWPLVIAHAGMSLISYWPNVRF